MTSISAAGWASAWCQRACPSFEQERRTPRQPQRKPQASMPDGQVRRPPTGT